MKNMDKHLEEVLQEKVITYKKLFGDNALYEALKEKEGYDYMNSSDYIEVAYHQDEKVKHIKIVGDLMGFSDYLLAKINAKYKMVVIKRINGKYYPMEPFEKGEYL